MVRLDGAVAVFFLLSGFLLYRPMIAHRAGGPEAPSAASYGRGRFLRIFPAYWLALTVLAIFPGLVGVFTGKWWVFYSMGDYFDRGFHQAVCPLDQQFRCGLPQTWTLVVEVTFYMVLPLYALLSARLARGRSPGSWMRAELSLLAVLGTTSLLLGAEPFSLHDKTWFEFTFIGHLFWLSLGMGLAIVSAVYGMSRDRYPALLRGLAARPGLCWAGAFAIYAFTVQAFYPAPFPVAPWTGFQYPFLNFLQGAAAVLLMIPVLFGNPNRGAPARLLRSRLLLWVGAISYGLYLWQVTPATDLGFGGAGQGFLVVLLGTIAISVPLAAASYYFLERPLMRFKGVPLRTSISTLVPALRRR
jgi:peptidoglycan/LPS O-acetylase OafA/YrhL